MVAARPRGVPCACASVGGAQFEDARVVLSARSATSRAPVDLGATTPWASCVRHAGAGRPPTPATWRTAPA